MQIVPVILINVINIITIFFFFNNNNNRYVTATTSTSAVAGAFTCNAPHSSTNALQNAVASARWLSTHPFFYAEASAEAVLDSRELPAKALGLGLVQESVHPRLVDASEQAHHRAVAVTIQ